ncbi:MAG: transporter substrate-binding domain-containing protein [Selenomonadaceae bacterium]|nr:transporter substrate-binding domain-containing protein [Selenomonadaceae bacterium]
MFAAFTFTGCKDDGEQNSADKNKKTRIGILTHLNVTEEKYNEYMEKLEKSYRPSKANLSADYSYFNNLNEMIMALDANKIDLMSTYKFVAEYMVKRKENLEIVPVEKNLEDSFCFAVREDDKELLKNLDDTISDMLSDGTMKNLSEKFIENVINGKEPEPVPIKEIDGADKIKVAFTGDLPSFDMVLADGSPAGFNTAVMAEIS